MGANRRPYQRRGGGALQEAGEACFGGEPEPLSGPRQKRRAWARRKERTRVRQRYDAKSRVGLSV